MMFQLIGLDVMGDIVVYYAPSQRMLQQTASELEPFLLSYRITAAKQYGFKNEDLEGLPF